MIRKVLNWFDRNWLAIAIWFTVASLVISAIAIAMSAIALVILN